MFHMNDMRLNKIVPIPCNKGHEGAENVEKLCVDDMVQYQWHENV